MTNTEAWKNIYENSNFGNRYPSSYLVSLFHNRIKHELLKYKGLEEMNVLDFACSMGANSTIFRDMGMNVYGIDISERAIGTIINGGDGDSDHFKVVNLLGDIFIEDLFKGIEFDLIIASECMYYFKDFERRMLIEKFLRVMSEKSIFYASMPTYDFPLYSQYKQVPKDGDGMIRVSSSGSINNSLEVNLPRNKEELMDMFSQFNIVDIMTVDTPIYSECSEKEWHIIAKK